MSKLQQAFDQLITDQAELQRKFQEQAQTLFKDITKEFFAKNPGVTAIVWTQYTPYFNDGDTCEFRVNDPTFTNAPDPENIRWEDYEGEEENVWTATNIGYVLQSDREWYADTKRLIQEQGGVDVESCNMMARAICSSEMEDVMLAMFGDHSKIVATRDGFEVEEYDHD